MKRRDFLRASAAGGAFALGASMLPRRAAAAPFGETPYQHTSVMLPEVNRAQSILECFMYGGLTTWETFYCVPEFGQATNTWAYTHYNRMVDAAAACNYENPSLFTPFANDSSGRTIYLGPYLKPLIDRADVLGRMRIVVNRHGLEPHEAAIPLAASGKSLGSPSLAGLGTHVGRYFVERDPEGTHPPPFAYGFATGSNFIPNDGILALVATGLHPGFARPLLVKVDNAVRLNTLLARTGLGGMDERAKHDALLNVYFKQYENRLRFGGQGDPVRAQKFQELLQASNTVASAEAIQSVFDPQLFEVKGGDACTVSNTINIPEMSLRLATHLLTHPTYPARLATVVDVGLRQADGGGGYDTHNEAPFTQSRNFNNFLASLLPRINLPGENDPAKIDLDKTMVILNMEFGRAPGAQNNGNGRNHWPYGYVQIYFGGPIGPAQKGIYGTIEESGQAKVFTTPAENRIAALLAMGIWPFDAAAFSGSDVQGQIDEGLAAVNVTKRVLGHEV